MSSLVFCEKEYFLFFIENKAWHFIKKLETILTKYQTLLFVKNTKNVSTSYLLSANFP